MTNTLKKNDNSKKKIAVILFGLILVIAISFGSLFAFFSDVITASTTDPIIAGTLGLTGSVTAYINGNTTAASAAELACINPGDSIKFDVAITNAGSKSAWLQNSFVISAKDGAGAALTAAQIEAAFTVYEGTNTGGTPLTGAKNTNNLSFTDAGKNVIDGTTEKETGTPPSGVTFIGAVSTKYTFTVIFDSGAGNVWQAAELSFDSTVSAWQYRNNPTPNWLSSVPENTYKSTYGIVTTP